MDSSYSIDIPHGGDGGGVTGVNRCCTARTPDHGKNVFTCQSRCMWSLILLASLTIQYHQFNELIFFVNLFFVYQIMVNWKLVRLRNPIFNDGVWFDDPPRGWDFCIECHHHRPPRSHHCPVCDVCILKRNHHCFFTGACIGLGNQRHFIQFLMWTSLAIIWALWRICPLLSIYYFPLELSVKAVIGYFLPPFFIFLPLLGYCTWTGAFFIYLVTFLVLALLISGSLFLSQTKLILLNQTEYEHSKQIKTYAQRGIVFNLKLIFGPNLILMPLACLLPKFNVRSREADCIYGRPQYTKVM